MRKEDIEGWYLESKVCTVLESGKSTCPISAAQTYPTAMAMMIGTSLKNPFAKLR